MSVVKREWELEVEEYYYNLNLELEFFEEQLDIHTQDERFYREIEIEESYTYDVCNVMLLT